MNPGAGSADAAVDHSDLVCFLREMILIRQLEQKALELSRSEPPLAVGSIHLCAGQEAVPVGTIAALNAEDQIVSTYRGHGWAIASGLTPVEVLGEICHRTAGINGGRAGSAYMMAPHRRFIGENSIVGAGIPIACGVAMANELLCKGRVVVVSVGDGAFNQGATHEGLAFAAARQLPLILICENNGWSEMTPTASVFRVERIAERAAGYGIPGLTIDGTDPAIVRDAIKQAAERARAGSGPTLIECSVPRLWGHYNRDIEHYRSVANRRDAEARDPITILSNRLLRSGVLTRVALENLNSTIARRLEETLHTVMNSPEPEPRTARDHVWCERQLMPNAGHRARTEPESKTLTYVQAVNEALRREMETRPEVMVYGEDVGKAGGIFGATRNLQRLFGAERVFDAPISESAILGSAVGAAIVGLKPIVEIMWGDFLLVALDQLVNQAANVRYMSRGLTGAPIVVRTQQGATPGSCAQHSQCLEALLLHIPGLRVATPATPQDAYSILRAAVAASDPCVVIEARGLYQMAGPVELSDEIEQIGKARLHRHGTDIAIVTWGTMLPVALAAADELARAGTSTSVLDLRWLCPLDEEALMNVVRAAYGRVIIAHEANLTAGFGAEISTRLHERLGREIVLRTSRVATPDTRMPASPVLQRQLLPTADRIVSIARQLMN